MGDRASKLRLLSWPWGGVLQVRPTERRQRKGLREPASPASAEAPEAGGDLALIIFTGRLVSPISL
jgi:hypothetical protein